MDGMILPDSMKLRPSCIRKLNLKPISGHIVHFKAFLGYLR